MVPDLTPVLVALGLSRTAAIEVWEPLGLYVAGIVLYSVFVFEFYRFVARRDIFPLRLNRYARGLQRFGNLARRLLNVVQYLVVFPVVIVLAALAFAGFLAFLATGYTADQLLLVAMTIVTSVRITAYYSEDLSRDLSKMLPFSLLGVYIVDGGAAVSFGPSIALARSIPAQGEIIMYFTLFTVCIEFLLRIGTFIVGLVRGREEPRVFPAAGAD